MAMDQASSTPAPPAASSYTDTYMSSSFTQTYVCFPISYLRKSHLEDGNRIIMPASALDRLISLQIQYPILFQMQNPISSAHLTHCGVLEFSAPEGLVYFPNWMMNNLGLKEGQLVNLNDTALPKGAYMKIRPHTMSFLTNLTDPKAFLESKLRDFSCVTTGDTIMICHNEQKYYIDVIETKPSYGISLVETDCEVEFAPPLDYKEPEPEENLSKLPAKEQEPDPAKGGREAAKFTPFTGVARRLDGSYMVVKAEFPIAAELKSSSTKRAGMVVFGRGDTNTNTSTTSQALVESKKFQEQEKNEEKKKLFTTFSGKSYRLGG